MPGRLPAEAENGRKRPSRVSLRRNKNGTNGTYDCGPIVRLSPTPIHYGPKLNRRYSMKRSNLLILIVLCALVALLAAAPGTAADSTGLRTLFADPPRQYSSSPLWVWNDMLSEEQVR